MSGPQNEPPISELETTLAEYEESGRAWREAGKLFNQNLKSEVGAPGLTLTTSASCTD